MKIAELLSVVGLVVLCLGCVRLEDPLIEGKPISHWQEQTRSTHISARRNAADMLGRTSSASVVPDLIRLLHDPEASVRLSAANSLFSKGRNGEQAVPDLIDLLNDEDGNVAISALWALKQVGPSEVVLPVFRKVIMAEDAGDAKFVLRVNAVNWLHTFGAEAKAAVPDLVKLIQDAERTPEDDQNRVSRASDLRFRAVESLGAIGPEATAAIPALKKLTNVEPKGFAPFMQIDGKPYFRALRDKAAEALRKIEK